MSLNYNYWPSTEPCQGAIVALHGFSGDSLDFEPLAGSLGGHYSILAIDLPGHGGSSPLGSLSIRETLIAIDACIAGLSISECTLLGYSMGGRIALHYALMRPECIKGLVLVSASPGIEDQQQRKQKALFDKAMQVDIEAMSIEQFMQQWWRQPLILSQERIASPLLLELRQRRLSNNKDGLIYALKAYGMGTLDHVWPKLKELSMPVLLLTGSEDHRYIGISEKMEGSINKSSHEIISDAGHMVHLEQPKLFAQVLERWIL